MLYYFSVFQIIMKICYIKIRPSLLKPSEVVYLFFYLFFSSESCLASQEVRADTSTVRLCDVPSYNIIYGTRNVLCCCLLCWSINFIFLPPNVGDAVIEEDFFYCFCFDFVGNDSPVQSVVP